MKRIGIASMIALAAALPAAADDAHHKSEGAVQSSAPASSLAEGEVRRVDKDAQKITVRHGPLPDLDMPKPMTMVYRVKDPAMLEKVKSGDKIRFHAEKINGAFTLTAIEPAQ
jgi:Cu/Ag efflux protein CusF